MDVDYGDAAWCWLVEGEQMVVVQEEEEEASGASSTPCTR